jgi:hypothetical protein
MPIKPLKSNNMKNSITYKAISTSGTGQLSTYYYEPVWGFSIEPFYFADHTEAGKHLPAAKTVLINNNKSHIIEYASYEFGIH